jgi:hypothetical protein
MTPEQGKASAVETLRPPTVSGFPNIEGYPSWTSWTDPGGTWEVTYGDDGCGILDGGPSGAKVITVSAGKWAGARWFQVENVRAFAAALIAAADLADSEATT